MNSPAALHRVTHGRGRPLYVVHGGLGWDHAYLRALDPLAERAQLVYFDLGGNGRSPEPERWEDVTHRTWVDEIDALRAELGHERIVLFGHSYGGFLALEYALRHPDRVLGLVLCATLPDLARIPAALERARMRAHAALYDTLVAGLTTPLADDEALARFSTAILPIYFHAPPDAETVRLFERMRFRARAYNHAASRCLPQYDVTLQLPQIKAPALVLSGRHDWLAPPEDGAERIAAGIAAAHSAVFENSGHFPFIEEPDAFLRTTSAWLDQLPHR